MESDQLVQVEQQLLDRDRDRGAVARDDRAVRQVRAVVALRPQVDVLLPHRAAVGDHGRGVVRDRLGVRVDGHDDADAVVGELHVADPADRTPR